MHVEISIDMRFHISSNFLLALVAFLAGAISIYSFSKEEFIAIFGENSNVLRVVEANLDPNHGFFDPGLKDFVETVSVHIRVRNFGNKPVILTSADAKIINSDSLEFATYVQGEGVLSEQPERNNAITIDPGVTKSIVLADGIKMAGITPFLESPEFKSEYYSDSGDFYILHNLSWVDRLNRELELRYGRDAAISISLYEKYKKPIKTHVIKFSEGGDIFDHSGIFQHDRFLGAVRSLHQN